MSWNRGVAVDGRDVLGRAAANGIGDQVFRPSKFTTTKLAKGIE